MWTYWRPKQDVFNFRDGIKKVVHSFQEIAAAVTYSLFHPIPSVFVIKAIFHLWFKENHCIAVIPVW